MSTTSRRFLVAEFQFLRDINLELIAWNLGRGHLWNDALAAIEQDNYDTDDELKGVSPLPRIGDDIDWLEAMHRQSHGHPGENCPVCYAEYELTTHSHEDAPHDWVHPAGECHCEFMEREGRPC